MWVLWKFQFVLNMFTSFEELTKGSVFRRSLPNSKKLLLQLTIRQKCRSHVCYVLRLFVRALNIINERISQYLISAVNQFMWIENAPTRDVRNYMDLILYHILRIFAGLQLADFFTLILWNLYQTSSFMHCDRFEPTL